MIWRTPDVQAHPIGRNNIDEPTLLAAAAQAGQPVTGDQLKRWRRAGLVPRPRTQHLLGLRGSRACYPDWAIEQLITVATLHRSIRRLKDLTVVLWWEGHWIERSALRDALITILEHVSEKLQRARANHGDPYDAADAILQRPTGGPRSPIVGLMSRRLGRSADVKSLLWTLLSLGFGGAAAWEAPDRSAPDRAPGVLELFAVAAGMQRSTTEDQAADGSWIPPDFELRDVLEKLRGAGAFDVEDIARPIRVASDAELDRARNDALTFCGPLAMIGRVLEGLCGDDVAGLGGLGVLAPIDAFDRAALTRTMLIVRSLAGDQAFTQLAALIDENSRRYAAIAALCDALPQHQRLLVFDFEERFAELAPAEARQVRADLTAYLERHPQIAAALRTP